MKIPNERVKYAIDKYWIKLQKRQMASYISTHGISTKIIVILKGEMTTKN